MSSEVQRERDLADMLAGMEQMCRELYGWREAHPEASFDEIADQVTPRRRELMTRLLEQLACQQGTGMVAEGVCCPECGQPMKYRGEPKRAVTHYLEGETALHRAYYHCEACHSGIFPPGSTSEVGVAQLDAPHHATGGAPGD